MAEQIIDRDKFRALLRQMKPEELFDMVVKCIDLLPQDGLRALAKGRITLARILDDGSPKAGLREVVQDFQKRSLKGEYYESFVVNWRNCSDVSQGTQAWEAEYRRLLDRCVAEEKAGDPVEVRQAFDALAGLVERIDAGEEILFFADDGGSWEFGVDWEEALPAWFRATAATVGPDAFAERVQSVVVAQGDYMKPKILAIAQNVANPDQRRALDSLVAGEGRERGAKAARKD